MLAFKLKNILNLVPEAEELIKKANLEGEYSVESKADCIASALRVEYERSISKTPVDYDTLEKVAEAVTAYGVKDEVSRLSKLMVSGSLEKSASVSLETSAMEKAASFHSQVTGMNKDMSKVREHASEAWELCKQAGVEPGADVTVYSGNGYLVKEAALKALNARFYATGDPMLAKVASAMSGMPSYIQPSNTTRNLLKVVSDYDMKHGLSLKGFDFYKEASVASVPPTAIRVRVGSEEFPVETLLRIPRHHISSYLGDDVAKEFTTSDPMTLKAMVESLPADLQRVLLTIIKSCK